MTETPPDDKGPLLHRVFRPRLRRVDLAVAALLLVLGFAAAVQVRSTQDEDTLLASARQEDLVTILDDLTSRSTRLRQEITTLTATRERLTTGSGRETAALAEARRRAQVLGVLAGTVPARGPGIHLTISDPDAEISADVLLDALEELRDAGAEAIEIAGPVEETADGGGSAPAVRVVAATHFVDAPDDGGVKVDGTLLRAPYRFSVIGDPATISAALAIPGGVIDNVEQRSGRATVTRSENVLVAALRPLDEPRYARPTEEPNAN